MDDNHSKDSGVGLERSCTPSTAEWLRSTAVENGVECLEAQFQRSIYQRHRHDTYAICLTTVGVQSFYYRGTEEISLPGQVVVLHPDELHDGRPGTEAGYGYRILYIEPALIFEAVQIVCGHVSALPFVRNPIVLSPKLAEAVTRAFDHPREPLAIDSLILQLAEGLIDADPNCRRSANPRHLNIAALNQARHFLDAEKSRIVSSIELESVTGLTRYDLARQFRAMYGTSPYRYLLMRRLDQARQLIDGSHALVDIALEAGFADQAHFTRMFKAAFGLTPARYGALKTHINLKK